MKLHVRSGKGGSVRECAWLCVFVCVCVFPFCAGACLRLLVGSCVGWGVFVRACVVVWPVCCSCNTFRNEVLLEGRLSDDARSFSLQPSLAAIPNPQSRHVSSAGDVA